MRFTSAFFCFALMIGFASTAHADIDQVQAREVARNNNCTPSKIDVYRQSMGTEGSTTYRVDCTAPKTTDPNAPKPASALLITCEDNLCQLLGPVSAEAK